MTVLIKQVGIVLADKANIHYMSKFGKAIFSEEMVLPPHQQFLLQYIPLPQSQVRLASAV